jgi:NADH-quinone oxidoreductase subunit L
VLDIIWLIPAFPLAGAVLLLLLGKRLGEPLAGWLATFAMGGSFVAAVLVFIGLLDRESEARVAHQVLFTWVPVGDLSVDVGFLADPLAITMTLFITGVGALIHLYSIGYMHGDPGFHRFFLYLNLFAFSMLVLVLGDNMLLTFLGWEGVGACSYLLISFWFTDDKNATAGKKAFVTNRIGDFGFMLAMFLVFVTFGSLNYLDVIEGAELGMVETTATAITLLLFVGAMGKSAQFPLYLWLPDAMAGPTPVSALIHAATMVTSGIYLLTRMNPVIAESADWVPTTVAWVGVFTALFAATIAIAQNDIKKVLAYSTVSQLGFMFLAVGTGAYVAAIFHMVTHAFFKALLFLGSGSVIHGMHEDQDMRHYGGLRKFMPITAATFIIGWLAIAGVPPFSGFWSKDEILVYAWNDSPALWVVGIITAVLTAFYMSRQVFMTFFGRYRYADPTLEEVVEAWAAKEEKAQARVAAAAEQAATARAAIDEARGGIAGAESALAEARAELAAAESALTDAGDADEKELKKLQKAVDKATKSVEKAEAAHADAVAAVPAAEATAEAAEAEIATARRDAELVGAGASKAATASGGSLFAPADATGVEDDLPHDVEHRRHHHPHESPWMMTLPLVVLAVLSAVAGFLNLPFTKWWHHLEHWLEPSLHGNEAHLDLSGSMKWILAFVAMGGAAIGITVAALTYLKGRLDARVFEQRPFAQGWWYDQAVSAFMGGPGRVLFQRTADADRVVVDGMVNGVAGGVGVVGTQVRRLQPGLVRVYALTVALGAALLLAWFLLRADF